MSQFHHLGQALDIAVDALQFLHRRHLWHHDFRIHHDAFLGALRRSFQNGLNLHGIDLGIGDAKAYAAVTQHGIHFRKGAHLLENLLLLVDDVFLKVAILEFLHPLRQLVQAISILLIELGIKQFQGFRQFFQCLDGIAHVVQVGDLQFQLGGRRQEFVHGRIKQAHSYRQAFHGFEDTLEIGTLDGQQPVQG